jgi:uncharacterized protein (DUF2147 family)
MKHFWLLVIIMVFSSSLFAQDKDAVLGKWKSEHGSGQIQIYKTGNKYFGKLIWVKEPNDSKGRPLVDIHNPNEKLRSRPIVGLEILNNFDYTGSGVWENGSVYNPKNGKTYSCKMTLINPNKLNLRGFMGVSLFGKSAVWSRM